MSVKNANEVSVLTELLKLLTSVSKTGMTASEKKELAATLELAPHYIPDRLEELPKICGLIQTVFNYFEVLSSKQNAAKNNLLLEQFCRNTGLMPKASHKPARRL